MTSVAATSSTTPTAVSSHDQPVEPPALRPAARRRAARAQVLAQFTASRASAPARLPTRPAQTAAIAAVNARTLASIDTASRPRTSAGASRTSSPIEPERQRQPAHCRQRCQGDCLGQQQPDHARARGAQGDAEGQFGLAGDTARRHQIGQVDAGDEQHAADRRQEQQQRPSRLADQRIELRGHGHAPIRVVVGVLAGQRGGQAGELGPRLVERDAARRRPTTWRKWAPRCSVIGVSPAASTRASSAIVSQSCGAGDVTGKTNPGALTPTIVEPAAVHRQGTCRPDRGVRREASGGTRR